MIDFPRSNLLTYIMYFLTKIHAASFLRFPKVEIVAISASFILKTFFRIDPVWKVERIWALMFFGNTFRATLAFKELDDNVNKFVVNGVWFSLTLMGKVYERDLTRNCHLFSSQGKFFLCLYISAGCVARNIASNNRVHFTTVRWKGHAINKLYSNNFAKRTAF